MNLILWPISLQRFFFGIDNAELPEGVTERWKTVPLESTPYGNKFKMHTMEKIISYDEILKELR
jgi:hypothetical protein